MLDAVSALFFIGFFFLLISTFQDIKTGFFDTKGHFYMKGLLTGCTLWAGLNLLVLFGLVILTIVINIFILRKSFGKGDKIVLIWLAPAFYVLSGDLTFYFVFWLVLSTLTLAAFAIRRVRKAEFKKRPYMPFIMAGYIITTIIYMVSNYYGVA